MAPGDDATKALTALALPTSLGGVADLPVKAACIKYLLRSASLIPQTIFRNEVLSATPGVSITGATALPVSQRLRSERKSFLSSPMLRLSTGLELLTMTTMGSPAASAGMAPSAIHMAARIAIPRIPAAVNRDTTLLFLFIVISVRR